VDKAKDFVEKLAPTVGGAVAKAKTPKEKAFPRSRPNQLFYPPATKLARDNVYPRPWPQITRSGRTTMKCLSFIPCRCSARAPATPDSAGRPGRVPIAMKVFQENPKHPRCGALHHFTRSTIPTMPF